MSLWEKFGWGLLGWTALSFLGALAFGRLMSLNNKLVIMPPMSPGEVEAALAAIPSHLWREGDILANTKTGHEVMFIDHADSESFLAEYEIDGDTFFDEMYTERFVLKRLAERFDGYGTV